MKICTVEGCSVERTGQRSDGTYPNGFCLIHNRGNTSVYNNERRQILDRIKITQSVWTYEWTNTQRQAEYVIQREIDAANDAAYAPHTPVVPEIGFKYDTTIQDEVAAAAALLYREADAVYRRVATRAGYVYGIVHPKNVDMTKIGFTSNPKKRLGDANTWCPDKDFELAFVISVEGNAEELEGLVHRALMRRGVRYHPKGEWFEINQFHAENLIEKIKRDPSYL